MANVAGSKMAAMCRCPASTNTWASGKAAATESISGFAGSVAGQQQDGHVDLRCLLCVQSGLGLA
jgi:hypothetical protein